MVNWRARFERAGVRRDAKELRDLASEINESRRNESVDARRMAIIRRKKQQLPTVEAQALLENHWLHLGLYKRVAAASGVDPSYVSKVARGKRKSRTVMCLLLKELHELWQQRWATGRQQDASAPESKCLDQRRNGSAQPGAEATSWNSDIAS